MVSTIPSFEQQLSFIQYEMGTGDGGNVAGSFNNNPYMSVEQASRAFESQYERPAAGSTDTRIENSRRVFNAGGQGISPRADAAYSYFRSQGWSPAQASGIVGNLMAESGVQLNPNSRNPGDGTDGSDSIGIAQWNSSRAQNLLNWDGSAVIPTQRFEDPTNNEGPETVNGPESAAEAVNEERAISNQSASKYQENILNQYDSYTYSWAIHMINPTRAQEFERNLEDGTYITLAESGIENEISIETVIQQTTLGFVRENRNAVSNSFDISFVEAKGLTFLNRIILAAQELGIRNHLEANYLLELNFRGWKQNNTAMNDEEIGPFYYVASITDFQIKHQDSGTNYQVTFIETEYNAYRRMDFHLKTDITVRASNFGDFLDNFTEELNAEVQRQVDTSIARLYPNQYQFGTEGEANEWRSWEFDAVRGDNLQQSRNVSVTAEGGVLVFVLHQGTSITAAIAAAILQTREFKRIPLVGRNQFAKDQPDDAVADAPSLAELMQWFMFSTNVEYLEPYDTVAKQYIRKFTYNIKAYTVPHGIHDPISFNQFNSSLESQQARLDNILRYGLLRKRYDYTYTGLNSEVLDVDLSLNNIFFIAQPIAGGNLGANSQFPGLTGSESDAFDARSRYNQTRDEVSRLESEQERLARDINGADPRNEDGVLNRAQIAAQANAEELAEQRSLLLQRQAERDAANQVLENTPRESTNFSPIADRYITQSDLYGGQSRANNSIERMQDSMQFDYRSVNDSLASSGADTNDDPGTAFLGALEINLNSTGELVEQRLNIRGDTYWLGKPKGAARVNDNEADYDFGGLGYFFNMRLPVYEDGDSGLMAEENFSITALYRVKSVTSQYMMGEFKQTLDSVRDTNTNNAMLIDQLLSGRIVNAQNRNLQNDYNNPNDDTDAQPNNVPGTGNEDTSAILDPTARGTNSGTITGSNDTTGSTSNIDSRLLVALENAAAAAGVTGVISPQGGNRGPGGSGRHNGYAADISLYDGTRLLSVENPRDLAIIQNYTQAFLNETRSAGLTPSVGIANPTQGTGRELYMSGTTHHYDIARTPGIGSSVAPSRGAYWGGSGRTVSHPAPNWLVNMYNS